MWQTYQRLIKQKPLLTSSITGASVMAVGDLIAQNIKIKTSRENEEKYFDYRRTFCMSVWSGVIMAPTFLLWFKKLDKWFPGNSVRSAMLKVVTNHAAVAVPFNAVALASHAEPRSRSRIPNANAGGGAKHTTTEPGR